MELHACYFKDLGAFSTDQRRASATAGKPGTRATGQRNWPTHPAVPPGTDDQNSTPARELEPPQPLLRSLNGGQHPCAKIGVSGEQVVVPVDLIVPEAAATGGRRRGARLGPHGNRAARRSVGLEAVLVDHDTMTVAALDPRDDRSIDAEDAGVAALLVAKAHKIHDRSAGGRADRLKDKDASDLDPRVVA